MPAVSQISKWCTLRTRALWQSLQYYALLSLVGALSLLPLPLLYLLSDLLFLPLYHIFRYRRRTVARNLAECFPDKTPQQRRTIQRRFYRYFIDLVMESCKLLTISPRQLHRRISLQGLDQVNAILDRGQSVSLLLGHFGNWEWVSTLALWLHPDATKAQIYHTLRSKPMNRLMLRMRQRMGSVCVKMNQTARYMAQAASSHHPHIIGFIADQSPRRRQATYFIPFLNHLTPVLTGTEKVTKHFGYQAVFLGMQRLRRGYYRCTFSTLCPDPSTLPDYELTSLYFQALQREILRQPELYLWSHKRFRYALPPSSTSTTNGH